MNRLICELIGTFFLVFAGTGAIIINDVSGGALGHVGIAMSFGLAVMALIYAFGDTSGAHLNPAVTLGFRAAKRISTKDTISYILAQIAGALLASYFLKSTFPTHTTLGATIPSISTNSAFLFEFLLTWLLMMVILSVATGAKEKGLTAAIAIGGTVGLEAMFAGPVTGASMNPARSLAPAIASGNFSHLWVYLLATTAGAIIAALSCKALCLSGCCEQPR
jgi:aquaporin NIP